jgi:hypothetical protein
MQFVPLFQQYRILFIIYEWHFIVSSLFGNFRIEIIIPQPSGPVASLPQRFVSVGLYREEFFGYT